MVIKKVILDKFARVFLSDIDNIEYDPEQKIQILLGTNGSGKSQVLSQLTPLPANVNNEYRPGGSKYIEIEHRGKEYVLISGLHGKNKHSFICDGKELNDGGTKKVQLELVKQQFGITPHINQVLLGNNIFTKMSPMERKKWITEISTMDYTYPIKVYNKMKQSHRDIVGAAKLLQESIIKMENGLLSNQEIKKLQEDRVNIAKFIEHLISLTSHDIKDVNVIKDITELDYSNKKLKSLMSELNSNEEYTKDLEVKIVTLNSEEKRLEERNVTIRQELDKLDKISMDDVNRVDVVNLIKSYTEEIVSIRDTIYINVNSNDAISILASSMEASYSDIVAVLGELQEYDHVDADTTLYKNLLEQSNKLELNINVLTNKRDQVSKELSDLNSLKNDSNKVECPKCTTSWYLNYDETKQGSLTDSLKQLGESLESKTKEFEELKKRIVIIESKREVISKIKNISLSYVALNPVWEYLLKNVKITGTGGTTKLVSDFSKLNMDIQRWYELIPLSTKLDKQNDLLKEIELSEKLKKDLHHLNKTKLLEELNSNTLAMNRIIGLSVRLKDLAKKERIVVELQDTIKDKIRQLYSDQTNIINKVRNSHIQELVVDLKDQYAELTNKLNDVTTYAEKIEDDKKTLKSYNEKEKVLKIMLKELSPSEGIIAKSINSFLNVFLSDINDLIATIWSYDMKLLPCEVSDVNDLDYKFRVKVGNEIINDIGLTSSSMQEMINLGFRVMFAKYLGLSDFPLILDEFGKTFDADHRISAYDTIDKIIAANHSQIFMVSHFEEMHGRFGNADISVLNTNGVELNHINTYNNVMKFKYL